MGDLQTYFYLALISVVMIGLTLTFVGIAAAGLWRWFKRAHGQRPLTYWLVGSAITLALLFILLGTAGALYGSIRYGTSLSAATDSPPVRAPRHEGVGHRGHRVARPSDR